MSSIRKAQTKEVIPDNTAIGRRLDAVRIASGLNRGEFAETCGIDPSSYTKIALGKKILLMEMGIAVCQRWGVSMDYLYLGRLNNLPEAYASTILATLTGKDETI